jgi:hypothetical protein
LFDLTTGISVEVKQVPLVTKVFWSAADNKKRFLSVGQDADPDTFNLSGSAS